MSEVAAAPESVAEAPPVGAMDSGAADAGTSVADNSAPAAPDVSWRESITDERARKLAERYNTLNDFANGALEKDRLISQRAPLPGENASEDDIARYHRAIGVPESPEGYDLQQPANVSDDVWNNPATQAVLSPMLEHMHKAGMTPQQVAAVVNPYMQAASEAAIEQARIDAVEAENAEEQLRKDWGPDYQANMRFANQFIETLPQLNELTLADNTLLASNPLFIRMASELGRLRDGGSQQLGLLGGEAGADAKQAYDDITRKMHDAYARGDKVEAQKLDQQRRPYSELLHGTQSVRGGRR